MVNREILGIHEKGILTEGAKEAKMGSGERQTLFF